MEIKKLQIGGVSEVRGVCVDYGDATEDSGHSSLLGKYEFYWGSNCSSSI